jgi:tetratricopeptide (TPR) repeat protein
MSEARGPQFQIKLFSGRVLGPLDLERIRLLIGKRKLFGNELARALPHGDWVDINSVPEIADLFVEAALSTTRAFANPVIPPPAKPKSLVDDQAKTIQLSAEQQAAATRVLPLGPEAGAPQSGDPKKTPSQEVRIELEDVNERTMLAGATKEAAAPEGSDAGNEEATRVGQLEQPAEEAEPTLVADPEEEDGVMDIIALEEQPKPRLPFLLGPKSGESQSGARLPRNIAREETVVFQRPGVGPLIKIPGAKRRFTLRELLVILFVGTGLGYFGLEFMTEEDAPARVTLTNYRARLPDLVKRQPDPAKSAKVYDEGLTAYLSDTVEGYVQAAHRFRLAATLDPGNVKALSMLASSYLNLIDSVSKDENYFGVISKLIDLAKAKGVDLPEIVIAETEFFVTTNRPEAAQNRIIEHTKTNPKFGGEMFFYIALALYHRGDHVAAARYVNQIPENRAFSAKIFYLKGQIAEGLGDTDQALREYEKAVDFNKSHLKSRLRIASILNQRGQLKEAARHLDVIVTLPHLLSPQDQAYGYYLHGLLAELFQQWDTALADLERAVKLDRGKSTYLLELYVLRGKAGESAQAVKKPVRMYYFLGEGEKHLRDGSTREALNAFLQARKEVPESPIPPLKIGDMFRKQNDLASARMNYRLAAERAPTSIEVWSKYIEVLIESYDWDAAQKAMDRFRKLPVSQSAIDKAAADMYAKQGRHVEAQGYYKRAMARESIDPDVYVAYAKSLTATRNFQEAPFYFAIALRYDPLSSDAILGTAKAVAASESVERAISYLQDELQKSGSPRAELLAGIAELEIQRGEWQQAQRRVDQSREANGDYAYPWKLQAQIHMSREGSDSKALERALEAYKSYSDRNPSDPSGYLERYQIFIKKTQYDKALEELNKIYGIYPKYPKLHYFKGTLYSLMGNSRSAVEEFQRELANHPDELITLAALGKELITAGAPQDAMTYLAKAMSLSPQWAEAKHLAGLANYVMKNYAASAALYQAALQFDSANPLIYKRLGMAYREMGDATSAAQAFRKYLEMEPDAPDRALFQKYR